MTTEEMKQYISDNEPSEVKRDELDRWVKRIWNMEDKSLEEVYSYKYSVKEVLENPRDKRDSYVVIGISLNEVLNV